MLDGVIPNGFQRFQVVAHIRQFHIADVATAGEVGKAGFEIDLFKGIDLAEYVEVERVGVITLVGHFGNLAITFLIELAEAVAQRFARRGIQRKTKARFTRPAFGDIAHAGDDTMQEFLTFSIIKWMAAKHQCADFVQADITQRNRGAAIFKQRHDVVLRIKPLTKSAFGVQNRRDIGLHAFEALNPAHQGAEAQLQFFGEQFFKARAIALGLDRNARQVQTDHAQIVAAIEHFTAFFIAPYGQEAAATHR